MSLQSPAPAPPPHVALYLAGATPEAAEFGFLIGEWSVEGRRFDAAGADLFRYQARWRAEYLHDRRLVLDDFTFLSPSGEELSAFVTLRTYAPASGRWEIAGLAALLPGLNGQWNGRAVGDEMHLVAEFRLPDGAVARQRERFYDIAADSFCWESLDSRDDGRTWSRNSALTASRVG
jgi:hypothetical protein